MKKTWIWLLPVVLLFGLVAGFTVAKLMPKPNENKTETAPAEEAAPGHVQFTAEQIESANIKTDTLHASTLSPDTALFGTLQEDPNDGFALRAATPAIIVPAKDRPWPNLGDTIPDNTTLGTLQPRLAPGDEIALATQRTALETQVVSAKGDLATAQAALKNARADYDRLKALNAQDKNVSDKAVEDALARQQTEEAHVTAAQQTLDAASASLAAVKNKLEPVPMVVSDGGQVVEAGASAGEAVESGGLIFRIAKLQHLLAAVSIPPDVQLPADVKTARIAPIAEGPAQKPVEGQRMGNPAVIDPKTQGEILLFRIPIDADHPQLRSGATVTALIPAEGEPLKGVAIPETAVVRYLGKSWVYIADGKNAFDRREVTLDHPLPDGTGWFAIAGFKDGDEIVTTGAPVLLSIEINAAFGGG